MRDAIQHGNNASLNSFLVGVRVAAKPMSFGGLKPYVQVSAGDGSHARRLKATRTSINCSMASYVGADKALAKHVDWRIIEISYGRSTQSAAKTSMAPPPIPAARILTVQHRLCLPLQIERSAQASQA